MKGAAGKRVRGYIEPPLNREERSGPGTLSMSSACFKSGEQWEPHIDNCRQAGNYLAAQLP